MCNFVQSISHRIDTGKCFLVGVCTYHHFGKDESGREFRWALKGEQEEEGEEKKRQLKPNTQVKCSVFLCEGSLVVSPVANEKRKQRECEVDTAPTKAWTGFLFWTALAHSFQGHVLANFGDVVAAWYDVIGIRAWVQALIFKIKRGFFAFLFKKSIKWSQIIASFNLRFYTISAWETKGLLALKMTVCWVLFWMTSRASTRYSSNDICSNLWAGTHYSHTHTRAIRRY